MLENICSQLYPARSLYWIKHMKRAAIVNFGKELGGQYTEYAFFCPLNMSLFGRTKWTQDLQSENQNRLQGLGICLRHFPFCILKNSFLRFLQWDMYHCIGLTKKGPVFFYFGFVATAFSFLQLWMRFISIFQTLSFSFFSLLKKVAQPQPDTPGPSSIYVTGREKNRPIWGAQNSNSMQIFFQNWTTWYIAHCVLCKVHFLAQPNKLRPILKV